MIILIKDGDTLVNRIECESVELAQELFPQPLTCEPEVTYEQYCANINQRVRDMIASKYSITDEIQLQNQYNDNPADAEYLEYRQLRDECVNWGKLTKQAWLDSIPKIEVEEEVE